MLDIKYIRANPELVKAALEKKHAMAQIDEFLSKDASRRDKLQEVEKARHDKNTLSEKVSKLKRAGLAADEQVAESREMDTRLSRLQAELKQVEADLDQIALSLPNLPDADVPPGESSDQNVEVRAWGEPRGDDEPPLPHWDLGPRLGFDFERGAKISGSGFVAYTGQAARLQRALINFMLDFNTRRGYTEAWPPYLVNRSSLIGTGQLPKLEEDMYGVDSGEMFLIPTAEVPLTNLHRDEILAAEQLPIRYCGFSACFRREAGAAGKDTRGLIRVHQFDKVEMVKFVLPDRSEEELELLTQDAEALLQALGLPYRVMLLCAGDLSFAAARCYDLEVYAPGVDRWLEVSSCSNFRDFQARRANIRYRPAPGARPEFVHTLNGSGLALPRIVVSVLEHYQRPDGSVALPPALQAYFDGDALHPAAA
ncbi:MAG TPA: serine--tRNA ligase [Armatimonadota bacterium]|nr:serine--tRNA ligase [Armatimonadota bacterium]